MHGEERVSSYYWEFGAELSHADAFKELSFGCADSHDAAEFWVKSHQTLGEHRYQLHDGALIVRVRAA